MKKTAVTAFVVCFIFLAAGELSAKSCKDVDSFFKNKSTTLKKQWDQDESRIEKEITELEKQIVEFDKKLPLDMEALQKKLNEKKIVDMDKIQKAFDAKIAEINKEMTKMKDEHKKVIEKMTESLNAFMKSKDEKEKEVKAFDAIKQKMDEAYNKDDQKILNENEKIQMGWEDEDRKFQKITDEDYQKKFDELNVKLAEWDKNESLKNDEVKKVEKEMVDFAGEQAEKLSKIQEAIEKERTDIQTKLKGKDNELEKEMERLDLKIAEEASKLQKELTSYTKSNKDKKEKALKSLKDFQKLKADYKKTHEKLVKSAADERNKKVEGRKAEREKQKSKWMAEQKDRYKNFLKELDVKQKQPLAKILKEIDKLGTQITDFNNKIENKKIELDNVLYKSELVWQKRTDKANGEQNTGKEETTTRYDNMEIEAKQSALKEKQKLEEKRGQLISKKESEKERLQKELDKMKSDYSSEKASCK